MAIGWTYNHYAIAVKTARNSGMIGSGCLELLLIGLDQLLKKRQNDFGRHCKHGFFQYVSS